MLKNRFLLIVLLLVMTACVVVVVLAYVLAPQAGVTKENFDRIEIGMTRAEVQKILGHKTAGYYISRFHADLHNTWEDEYSDDRARLEFDANDCVTEMHWLPGELPDERTAWEKLLDRLPWRERSRRPKLEVL
jgi:outer membrane protein assembly factor BamE (lipoprotein component of BamABCDE complex)